MVARETSNLEAAGSSPALGSSDDHPKSCSFFGFSFAFLGSTSAGEQRLPHGWRSPDRRMLCAKGFEVRTKLEQRERVQARGIPKPKNFVELFRAHIDTIFVTAEGHQRGRRGRANAQI
jgi:hypothetical protein